MLRTLADTVYRKFVNTFRVKDWDIQTPHGWIPVESVSQTVPYDVWFLFTESGKKLRCADDHIVFAETGEQIFVKDIVPMKTRIMTIDGPELVLIRGKIATRRQRMYDLSVQSEDHAYYSNGILSHNSTTTCAFLLHTVLFKEEQNICILANKGATARKLLRDFQKCYMALPKWLQQGVLEWNKGSAEWENGCKIMAASTSSDAIRGNAFNVIFLDEFAFVPSHIADEFFASVYPTISSGESTKVLIVSTPKGHNMFYKMWTEAHHDRNSTDPAAKWNGYEPFGISWRDVPGRDDKWRDMMVAATSELQFKQEFESVTGDTLIQVQDMETGLIHRLPIDQFYEFCERRDQAGISSLLS